MTDKRQIEDKETILEEALTYMASMYGLRLSKCKLDDYIEYSCNGYTVNKETYDVLQKAKRIVDFWEE